MNNISKEDIHKAAKLTYFEFLNGLASKEEDFRCILYFHLRNLKVENKSNDTILLNPKKFGKYPDIVIIQEDGQISYIEIKQFINSSDSSKDKLSENIKKLEMYKLKDKHYRRGYLIHFYRNFQVWTDLNELIKDDKDIDNIYFPNEDYESIVTNYLSNPVNYNMIINESLSFLENKGIVNDEKEFKDKIIELISKAEDGDYSGWIPINSYIERDEFLNDGYKKVIKSLVSKTRNSNKPVRFYSDILSLSNRDIKNLKGIVETGRKDLIDLFIILRVNELIRLGFLSEMNY